MCVRRGPRPGPPVETLPVGVSPEPVNEPESEPERTGAGAGPGSFTGSSQRSIFRSEWSWPSYRKSTLRPSTLLMRFTGRRHSDWRLESVSRA